MVRASWPGILSGSAGRRGGAGAEEPGSRLLPDNAVKLPPDMTRTGLYRNADFTASGDDQAALLPEEVARAVEFVVSQREGLVVSGWPPDCSRQITLRPLSC